MIALPLLAGLSLTGIKSDRLRNFVVVTVTTIIFALTLALAGYYISSDQTTISIDLHAINIGMVIIEVALTAFITYLGWKHKRPLVVALAIIQCAILLVFEWQNSAKLVTSNNLMMDKLSIIMALVIGLVGGVICLYAIGYMREFHEDHHPEVKDRRNLFFGVLFVFLGAMFGIVFANNLLWLYFFWEITTLCSFLLIGYKQDEQSTKNAFHALLLNLVGGLAFAIGIVHGFDKIGSIELTQWIQAGKGLALVPAAFLCFSGLTKSAQLPFSSWLLGAMVAPTPVSALLHSSTMVKAGVYLIVRFAPVMTGTKIGILIALVGAITFLIGSFAAIGTSDAKKVLAYSTVANLGLIVLCGGVGTYEAVWAAILLIVFHAVAKCLLFLCVGVVEHKIHSRDIEAMSGLVISMPKVSVMLQIGIAGMFLAPFGMLISKWAVLKALVDVYPLLTIFIVFGSAATLFFWVKWMGKMIEVTKPLHNVESGISAGEWFALYFLSILTAMTCIFFPVISSKLIEPYIVELYGTAATMDHGNWLIMIIMLFMVALFPLSFINYGRKVKVLDPYMGGSNTRDSLHFHGSVATKEMSMKNYYFSTIISETKLFRAGVISGISLLVILIGAMLTK